MRFTCNCKRIAHDECQMLLVLLLLVLLPVYST
jgi:hypothetical protein